MRSALDTSSIGRAAWSDVLVAAMLSVVAAIVAGIFDVHEGLYEWTRRWERLQLDEWPMALTVFACCLLLLYVRRYRETRAALRARHEAEAALEKAFSVNRGLARQHLLQQEAERKHLARELHDELGQYLNAIKLDAVAVSAGTLSAGQQVAAGSRIVASADHVHATVSDMIRRLRPVGLDELGLEAALEHCIDQWRQRLPDVQLTLRRDGELDGLGEALDLTVYRVVQEAVTNASRHARARHVDVRIARLPDEAGGGRLEVVVADDGVGIDAPRVHEGFGLAGMRERLELLGGELRLTTAPGEGCTVVARLPIAKAVA